MCLVVSEKAYRFGASEKRKVAETLRRLLESEENDRVKAAAATALAEVTE
jgi:Holliday junction resolvasome RuvABC endonuclease subunit